MTLAEPLTIAVSEAITVSALRRTPAEAFAAFVFAHGAGAGMNHAFMETFADGLADRGVASLRFNFPAMERGSRRTDPPALAQAAVRAAVAEAARSWPALPLFAGGKSFGGRMSSQAHAEAPLPGVRGLVFAGFPLHPAGKPSVERAAHLADAPGPLLFLQGSRDALADLALLRPVVASLGERALLAVFDDADHAFHVRASSGRTDADVRDAMLDTAAGVDAPVLKRYTEKRDFSKTPEPAAAAPAGNESFGFVVQKHWASRLHYDFRLELDGVLVSWAVPRGPCYDPKEKRMAVHVEDHPVSYASFEGTIPKGSYGAGKVIVWDRGRWTPVGDPRDGMAQGKLIFDLHGDKLAGRWELVRIAKPGDRQDPWMLFKKRDAWARSLDEYDVISALPDSVIEHPLGPIEARQPRAASAQASAAPALPDSAADLPGAQRGEVPQTLSPQLATATDTPPRRGEWLYELKFDGYRLLARFDAQGKVALITRNGHDWTAKMKPLAAALAAWKLKNTWLDGEIVVPREDGTPDFNALQNALDSSRSEGIRYFLFDTPFFDGVDLRAVPLYARRAWLQRVVEQRDGEPIRWSAQFPADPASLLESAKALGLEGIIAKRADAPYVSRRSDTWLKLKIAGRQELVIGGFTVRQGSTGEIGSLMLGVHDAAGQLVHAGSVGTGWDSAAAAELYRKLAKIETKESPFAPGSTDPGRWSRRAKGSERWVQPQLAAEVRFAGWTPDGHVRHAVFMALREGRASRDITREPVANAGPADRVGKIKVTHPQRVIDPESGHTKLDLVRYYESVAELILPHLKGRPVSLVRGPDGVGGTLFFQKHDDKLSIPGLRELDAKLWPGHAALLEVPSAEALIACAQMNVIEFHTWNSTVKKIDQPDRMVFDLDPGEGVGFDRVREAAVLVRALLDELGLRAWLKTSGGKGLHVVVPITPKLDYDTVKDTSQAIVQHLAKTIPQRFVAKSGAANRVGKIFVDYLRNGHGATTATAFSARARPGLGVSVPVAWDDLPSLKSGAQWTIATAREHVSLRGRDPWAEYFGAKQTLRAAIERLGLAPKLPRR